MLHNLSSQDVGLLREFMESRQDNNVSNKLRKIIDKVSASSNIVRIITTEQGEQQASVMLVSYVYNVINSRHPNIDCKVSVEQSAGQIQLSVIVASEHHEAVEDTVEKYGQTLQHSLAINALLKKDADQMAMKQCLDLSALQANVTKELLAGGSFATPTDFANIQDSIVNMHKNVGTGLTLIGQVDRILNRLSDNAELSDVIKLLKQDIDSGVKNESSQEALSKIQKQEPDAFDELREVINKSSNSGKAGDTIYNWITTVSGIMPH